jgi:hypothetical protein
MNKHRHSRCHYKWNSVSTPQVRTTPHIGGPAGRRDSRWLTATHSGSSDNDLRSRWPNSSSNGFTADAAVTSPSPTSPLEGRGQAIKAKEPEARSADGGGDPVGDEPPPPQRRRRKPSAHRQIPTRILPDGRAPTSAQRRRTRAKAGQPKNTNVALAARDVLGGPPVRATRQPHSRREGAPGAEPEPAEPASPTR